MPRYAAQRIVRPYMVRSRLFPSAATGVPQDAQRYTYDRCARFFSGATLFLCLQ
jgi:hypothetical protein